MRMRKARRLLSAKLDLDMRASAAIRRGESVSRTIILAACRQIRPYNARPARPISTTPLVMPRGHKIAQSGDPGARIDFFTRDEPAGLSSLARWYAIRLNVGPLPDKKTCDRLIDPDRAIRMGIATSPHW